MTEPIQLAFECAAEWNSMHGDERIRFCDHCKKDVHNITDLDAPETIALLSGGEVPCVRFAAERTGARVMMMGVVRDPRPPRWKRILKAIGLG